MITEQELKEIEKSIFYADSSDCYNVSDSHVKDLIQEIRRLIAELKLYKFKKEKIQQQRLAIKWREEALIFCKKWVLIEESKNVENH